jgi:hypothetical protein
MSPGSQLLVNSFDETARQVYYELFSRFTADTSSLDRNTDDNVFQLTKNRYLYTLQKKLDIAASDALDQKQGADSGALQKAITQIVSFYLNEFKRKCSSL